MVPSFITGLDIGSQSVKAAVAEIKKTGQISLQRIVKMPSQGMRRGVVDDVADVTRSVNQVIGEIKKFHKAAIRNIFLSVGGSDVKVRDSKGIIAVSRADSEIQKDDIERAVEASQAVKLANNRTIVHAITKEFVVDEVGDIRDPSGMIGNRLEVNSLIIEGFEPNIRKLTKCVESAGGSVSGLFFTPLSSARAVLSKNQKNLGVVMVDIGLGKTSICVYEEGKLLHAAVLPLGSGHITNDLAIGLKISIPASENIKLSLGLALARETPGREKIDLRKFDPGSKKVVMRRLVAEIIEDRLAEIFDFVNNELKQIGKVAKLPAGTVLTGGGSKMPAIVDLAKQELRLSAQVGVADLSELEITSSDLAAQAEDPEFSCAFGLILSGGDRSEKRDEKSSAASSGWLKKFFRNFLP